MPGKAQLQRAMPLVQLDQLAQESRARIPVPRFIANIRILTINLEQQPSSRTTHGSDVLKSLEAWPNRLWRPEMGRAHSLHGISRFRTISPSRCAPGLTHPHSCYDRAWIPRCGCASRCSIERAFTTRNGDRQCFRQGCEGGNDSSLRSGISSERNKAR